MSADDSPPRTPPSQSARYKTTRRGARPRPSVRETFLDGSGSENERDPHDLSLSPQHAARTSIVDNMLLSLDQYAPGSSVLDDYRLFNSALESNVYSRNSQESKTQRRHRGHTLSSSLSSDADFRYDVPSGRYGNQTPRGRRSNSSSTYQQNVGRTGSSRNWENQQLDQSTSYGRFPDDSMDAAPTPSIPGGPRKRYSPRNDSGPASHQSSLTPVASRRSSVKSARPVINHPTGSRQENIGTSTLKRDKDYDNVVRTDLDLPPAIPAASIDPAAPSPTIGYNKPSFPSPAPEPAPGKDKPGFFRRVFGSSKSTPPGSSGQGQSETSPLQTRGTKDGNGVSADVKGRTQQQTTTNTAINTQGRQGPQQVVNKKSSFFRRRKKPAVDNNVPPPIMLPQDMGSRAVDVKPEPSPATSLRQAMDPFLADAAQPGQDRLEKPKKLTPTGGATDSPNASTSEVSNYYTASNTPVIPSEEPKPAADEKKASPGKAPENGQTENTPAENGPTEEDKAQARKLFDSQDQVAGSLPAAAWLGDVDRALVREAYMALFNWSDMNVLRALRSLCNRLVLKGETQQVDRVLDAFSTRWCQCNPRHGFKSAGKQLPSIHAIRSNVCRCCSHYLLLAAATEHRPPPGRYRAENDQNSVCPQHLAHHSPGSS